MVELTAEQAEIVGRAEQPPLVVDPRTGEEFVLLTRSRYETMQKWLTPLKRYWDDPTDDDLIRQP